MVMPALYDDCLHNGCRCTRWQALFVCYAEDPAPLAAISTPLYSLFIQHPYVAPEGGNKTNGATHLPRATCHVIV